VIKVLLNLLNQPKGYGKFINTFINSICSGYRKTKGILW